MTRDCPHCSAPLDDGAAVCPSCGRSVVADPAEAPTADGAPDIAEGVAETAGVAEEVPEAAPEQAPDMAPEEALGEEGAETLVSAPDAAPEGAADPEIRFDTHEDPNFEAEPSELDEVRPGDGTTPAPAARYVVFRCERCQMPLVPGTSACLRCGLQRAKPVPNIPVHASPQSPLLRQGEYHCPECQAVLAPQSNLCTNCGAEFVAAVPPVRWGTPNVGATRGDALVWTRPTTRTGPEAWKIIAAVIAVVAFAAVLVMIGALSAGPKPTDDVVTTVQPPISPVVTTQTMPAAAPVVLSPGAGGAGGQVHASPVGTWVKGRNTIRLDEIGGAWVDAPSVTGTKSKVNLNWALVDTKTGQVVHVQGPGYTWDFAWNFGPDGSQTLTQPQWGELQKLPDGSKPGGTRVGIKGAPKPSGIP